MKELSIEAKAKRYDKAIEIAKSKIKNDKDHVLYEDDVIEIFPELKVSDDERIRKSLIELFHDTVSNDEIFCDYGLDKTEVLAWLEKQGEQKPVEWCSEDEQNLNVCLSYIPHEFLRRWLKDIIHIKYDKPIDRVEPKFKIGDWIVYNRNDHSRKIMQIYDIRDNRYYFNDNIHFSWSVKECDEKSHLWTINDAKDGDVLRLGDVIAIFKKYIGQEKCICYCSFCDNCYCSSCGKGGFEIPIENGEDNVYGCTNTIPATKEQQDLLFQKMKEEGYEWNKDKKKLIKL